MTFLLKVFSFPLVDHFLDYLYPFSVTIAFVIFMYVQPKIISGTITIKQAGAELGQAQFSYQLDTGLVWNLAHLFAYFLTCLQVFLRTCLIACFFTCLLALVANLFTCLLACLLD